MYLEEFEDVEADVVVCEGRIEDLEVGVVHILEYEAWGFRLRVSDDVQKFDDVGASAEILQNLYFTFYLKKAGMTSGSVRFLPHDPPLFTRRQN